MTSWSGTNLIGEFHRGRKLLSILRRRNRQLSAFTKFPLMSPNGTKHEMCLGTCWMNADLIVVRREDVFILGRWGIMHSQKCLCDELDFRKSHRHIISKCDECWSAPALITWLPQNLWWVLGIGRNFTIVNSGMQGGPLPWERMYTSTAGDKVLHRRWGSERQRVGCSKPTIKGKCTSLVCLGCYGDVKNHIRWHLFPIELFRPW